MNLHAVHEERAVAGDHDGAPTPAERHADAGAEAVAHAAHPERDHEPAAAAHRQVVDGGRAGVAGVDDDVRAVGQHARRARRSRRGTARPGPSMRRRLNSVRGTESRHPHARRRPCPVSATASSDSEPRRSSVCTWVDGTYGGADPIERVGTDASASSRPARAVTDMRVPTSRHTALLGTASATPGWPITPVTPSADDDPARCTG